MAKGKRKREQNRRLLILLLVLALIAAIAVAVWALFFRDGTPILNPDGADQNARSMEEEDEGKMEAPEGGGAVSMAYQQEVFISLSDGTVSMLFQNPAKSVNELSLQLVVESGDEEVVIAQSGKLLPGYELKKMELIEDAAELAPGTYHGKYRVLYYDPDSGEQAMVNSEIEDLTIQVTE